MVICVVGILCLIFILSFTFNYSSTKRMVWEKNVKSICWANLCVVYIISFLSHYRIFSKNLTDDDDRLFHLVKFCKTRNAVCVAATITSEDGREMTSYRKKEKGWRFKIKYNKMDKNWFVSLSLWSLLLRPTLTLDLK